MRGAVPWVGLDFETYLIAFAPSGKFRRDHVKSSAVLTAS
jgi:hypothetical protein